MSEKHKCPAVRVGMFPKDTNASGTNIFGGVILSHMDIAGAIAAGEVTDNRVFTVSFDKVVFKRPVHIGDVLTCWSEVTKIGRTSITTRIVVEAQRKGVFIPVTEGEAVYVAVDDNGRPTPANSSRAGAPNVVHECTDGCHNPSPVSGSKKGVRKRTKRIAFDTQKCPAIRIGMMPKDTSVSGTNIFAGVILSHMDTAAGIAAREVTKNRVVTVSFDKVIFKEPVHVGDTLTCWSEVVKTGRTSITIRIIVQAQRKGIFIPVTEGEAVFVCVDEQGKPIPVGDPPAQSASTSSCGSKRSSKKKSDKKSGGKNKTSKKK